MIRFIIAVDIEDAGSLERAYQKLYNAMSRIKSKSIDWESSNEAYWPCGERIDERELDAARMEVVRRDQRTSAERSIDGLLEKAKRAAAQERNLEANQF